MGLMFLFLHLHQVYLTGGYTWDPDKELCNLSLYPRWHTSQLHKRKEYNM